MKEPGAEFYDTKLDTSFSRITTSQEAEKVLQEHTPDSPLGEMVGEFLCGSCMSIFRIYGARDGQDAKEAAIMVWQEHQRSGECRRFIELIRGG